MADWLIPVFQAILISTRVGANTDGALTPGSFLVTLMPVISVSTSAISHIGFPVGFSVLGLVIFDWSRPRICSPM